MTGNIGTPGISIPDITFGISDIFDLRGRAEYNRHNRHNSPG
jgi:hypothetical protein